MGERIGESIAAFLSFLPPELIIFIISLLPILELRIGLIVASVLGISYIPALIICVIGCMIPIPFIIFFIRRILTFLQKHGPIKKFATWIEDRGVKQGAKFEQKYPKAIFLGLFLFVSIPIPGTGAWTGSLIAALLGIPPKRAIPALMLGVLGSAAIMSFISYGLPALVGWK